MARSVGQLRQRRVLVCLALFATMLLIGGCGTNRTGYRLMRKGDFADAFFSRDMSKILREVDTRPRGKPYYAAEELWYEDLNTGKRRLLFETRQYEHRPSQMIEDYEWHSGNRSHHSGEHIPGIQDAQPNVRR